ncbi:TRAM domain-containing protein, partial [Planctomycetota bacterium]
DLPEVRVEILELADEAAPVDRRLVSLCGERAGRLVTTDAALAKLCELDKVGLLNLHEIARTFQLRAQAGDRLELRIVKAGEEAGQGVGYLDDGAMVVVESARDRVGKTVTVEVTSGLKTRSGQMYFAKLG